MNIPEPVMRFGITRMLKYVKKDPDRNLIKIMNMIDKIMGDKFQRQRKGVRKVIENPADPYNIFIRKVLTDTDFEQLKTFVVNFFLNVNNKGWPIQDKLREQYNCNIPWAILLDPTSACNLHCKGCWAGEYGNRLNLSFDEIDDIITQGKELGIYMYIYTGGEPLVRKNDLINICRKHSDCIFLSFTNGTLIDEEFADRMLEVKNFVPAISLEGFEEATDSRRGTGTYQKVLRAIDILKKKHLIYGISACYTRDNMESITSEEFYDKLIELGVYFIWYFHYMPVGADAVPDLIPTPEQRVMMFKRLRDYRSRKPLFAMDFQNDGEYVGGCIAGGRRYLHINANGDVDPCVFIHYSNANIRKMSLLDCLRSPLFQAYHDGQPFNDNMLRPCPMLENPEILPELVKRTGAHPTDYTAQETPEQLCEKCKAYSESWAPVAADLWKLRQEEKAERARQEEEEEKSAVK